MTVVRQSAYAMAVWTLPLVVWIASSLVAEATAPGGAARASARIGPALPVLQCFALALLVPALAWRQSWGRSAGIAALIVVGPWPAGVLLAQTGGVSYFGLGIGQFLVWLFALLAIAVTRLTASAIASRAAALPATQAVLICAGIVLTRATAPVIAGMVGM